MFLSTLKSSQVFVVKLSYIRIRLERLNKPLKLGVLAFPCNLQSPPPFSVVGPRNGIEVTLTN